MKTDGYKSINIPVYRTKTEEEEILLFNITKDEMVDNVCKKINDYKCSTTNKITIDNSGKSYTNEIVHIKAERKTMHDSPCVFIQMSAHKTNLNDGYIETSKKIPVTKDVKIGSDHHYIIMYPMIIKGRTKYKRYWNIFIYDDPNKDSAEFIRMSKEMIKLVLGFQVCNLKKKDFIEEIKECKVFTNITANFQTVEFIDNQYDADFKEYIIKGQIYSKKVFELKNVLSNDFLKMLDSYEDLTVKRKQFIIPFGKKEYKIKQEIKKDYQRAKEKYRITIESHFNEKISLTEEEYANKLYDIDFVIEKMEDVVINYMS